MGNNLREEDAMLPDLNQEPLGRPTNLQIRPETDSASPETALWNHKGSAAKNSTELIARALATEPLSGSLARPNNGGDFFSCNACLSLATEPVLTCCGHLFCWPCFYNLPYGDSDAKECLVCGGEVADSSLVPVYGNGDCSKPSSCKRKKLGLDVPPRPAAKRVESSNAAHHRRGSGRSVSQIEQRIRQLTALASRAGVWESPFLNGIGLNGLNALNFSRVVLPQPSSLQLIESMSVPETLVENSEESSDIPNLNPVPPPFRTTAALAETGGASDSATAAADAAAADAQTFRLLSPGLIHWMGMPSYGNEGLEMSTQFDESPFSATSPTPPRENSRGRRR